MKDITNRLKRIIEIVEEDSTLLSQSFHIIQAYNISRCADALERVADQLESGSTKTLDGEDIVKQLGYINAAINRSRGI